MDAAEDFVGQPKSIGGQSFRPAFGGSSMAQITAIGGFRIVLVARKRRNRMSRQGPGQFAGAVPPVLRLHPQRPTPLPARSDRTRSDSRSFARASCPQQGQRPSRARPRGKYPSARTSRATGTSAACNPDSHQYPSRRRGPQFHSLSRERSPQLQRTCCPTHPCRLVGRDLPKITSCLARHFAG